MEAFEQTLELINSYLEMKWAQAAIVLATFVIMGVIAWLFITNILRFIARKADLQLDDVFLEGVRSPVTFTIMITGVQQVIEVLKLPHGVEYATGGLLFSAVVLVWMNAARKMAIHFLRGYSLRTGSRGFFSPKTLPLTTLITQALIYLFACYFLMRAWGVDATAWLASAGVLGMAIGFAAQNTLSNLLAGVSIMTDPPFEVGDFVEIDQGQSGIVKNIGLRTTRIWTLDDVELVLPNSVVTSKLVTNATAGPDSQRRLQLRITLDYGGDVDEQTATLLEASQVDGVLGNPEPKVWLSSLADFGVEYVINVWVATSEDIEPCRDRINRNVIRLLADRGQRIPFPRYDLQMVKSADDGKEPTRD